MIDYKEKWKRQRLINSVLLGALIAITSLAVMYLSTTEVPGATTVQVTDKAEEAGRFYIETWIEVTPEEYIGLEKGDEYEVKRKK